MLPLTLRFEGIETSCASWFESFVRRDLSIELLPRMTLQEAHWSAYSGHHADTLPAPGIMLVVRPELRPIGAISRCGSAGNDFAPFKVALLLVYIYTFPL